MWGTWSSRVDGSYVRSCAICRRVLIHLAMSRFLCTNAAREKVTFAGQADGLTARYQRWSVLLSGLLSQIALELAARAGLAAGQGAGYRGAPRHAARAGHRPAGGPNSVPRRKYWASIYLDPAIIPTAGVAATRRRGGGVAARGRARSGLITPTGGGSVNLA
jgi:hypothetical protein